MSYNVNKTSEIKNSLVNYNDLIKIIWQRIQILRVFKGLTK